MVIMCREKVTDGKHLAGWLEYGRNHEFGRYFFSAASHGAHVVSTSLAREATAEDFNRALDLLRGEVVQAHRRHVEKLVARDSRPRMTRYR